MPKPRTYAARHAALKALHAAYVRKSGDYDRDDDDDLTPHQKSRFGLPAPLRSSFHWSFRAVRDDEDFSLVEDCQETIGRADKADEIAAFIAANVVPVLQHKARQLDSRDYNFYHFHFDSEFGLLESVITTRGPSGYVYGCVYIEQKESPCGKNFIAAK